MGNHEIPIYLREPVSMACAIIFSLIWEDTHLFAEVMGPERLPLLAIKPKYCQILSACIEQVHQKIYDMKHRVRKQRQFLCCFYCGLN